MWVGFIQSLRALITRRLTSPGQEQFCQQTAFGLGQELQLFLGAPASPAKNIQILYVTESPQLCEPIHSLPLSLTHTSTQGHTHPTPQIGPVPLENPDYNSSPLVPFSKLRNHCGSLCTFQTTNLQPWMGPRESRSEPQVTVFFFFLNSNLKLKLIIL